MTPVGRRPRRASALPAVLLAVVLAFVGVADATAATRYVAVGGVGSACTAATPCGSLNQAYRAAAPGDTVRVAPGSYPSQTIGKDPTKALGSPQVAFQMTGARFSDIRSSANDVHYIGPTASTIIEFRAGRNVVLSGAKAQRPYIIGPVSSSASGDTIDNITIRGGDFGPLVSCGSGFQINTLGGRPASNIKIVGNRFHDYTIASSCPDAHLDCLHTFRGINGLVIAGNTFTRCHDFGVLINGASNVLVENNFIDGGIFGFKLRGDTNPSVETFTNVTIRNNSADYISLGDKGSNTLSNVLVDANATVDGVVCRSSATYRNNLAERGTRCSGSDFAGAGPIGFADPDAGDFHVPRSSPAVDRIAGGAPATDIDGNPRPQGSKHDIGADEFMLPTQSGSPAGGRNGPGSRGPGSRRRSRVLRPSLRPAKRTLRLHRGAVRVRVVCRRPRSTPSPPRCRGTLALWRTRAGDRRARPALLGRKRFSIRSGRVVRLKLRLRPAARRAVRRHPIRAKLRVVVKQPGGGTARAAKRVIVAAR